MSGLSLETPPSNLKSVALTILELLAFNAQNFRGSGDHGHSPISKKLRGHVRTVTPLSLETRTSNLKSVGLSVLELLLTGPPETKVKGQRSKVHHCRRQNGIDSVH